MIRVNYLTPALEATWDQFVLNHDDGNAFHTSAIVKLNAGLDYLRPIVLIAFGEDDEIIGGVVGVASTEKPGLLSFLSTRAIQHGGVLLPEDERREETLRALIVAYDREARRGALFGEVWLFSPLRDDHVWARQGYSWSPHLNFLIDLENGAEALWSGFSSSRRKNIRRSGRAGVVVENATTWEEIHELQNLIQSTYRRLGVPVYPESFFRSVFDKLIPQGFVRCFLARHEERIIGGRIVLLYKDVVYDWYAGSLSDAKGFYPDEAIVWNILQWGVENGFKLFNFGGAGHPDIEYGPREFKRRFGGELVNHGRLRRIYAPIRTFLIDRGFPVYRGLASKLGKLSQKRVEES